MHAFPASETAVHLQRGDRRPADIRSTEDRLVRSAPPEVVLPVLLAWMKQWHAAPRMGIHRVHARSLGAITVDAREREVVEVGTAALAARHDVVEFQLVAGTTLRRVAVLAPVMGASGDEWIHGGRLARLGAMLSLPPRSFAPQDALLLRQGRCVRRRVPVAQQCTGVFEGQLLCLTHEGVELRSTRACWERAA